MSRGMYGSVLGYVEYQQSQKRWYVELQRSDMYWFDLIFDSPAEFDSRSHIVDKLKQWKKAIEENLEKRFVYFICTRKKIRFDVNAGYSYNLTTKALVLNLLVGERKQPIKCEASLLDADTKNEVAPMFEMTDCMITQILDNGDKYTSSIHEFLSGLGINLGINTRVHYVGYTKNPDSRPTNGAHRGLTKLLRNCSTNDEDVFIFFNVFKVVTTTEGGAVNFVLPNAMTNEVNVEKEGKIIEKSYILYFDSDSQNDNKALERRELYNNLSKLANENSIINIQYHYEVEGESEYWCMYSSTVDPKFAHVFTVEINESDVAVSQGSEMYSSFNSENA